MGERGQRTGGRFGQLGRTRNGDADQEEMAGVDKPMVQPMSRLASGVARKISSVSRRGRRNGLKAVLLGGVMLSLSACASTEGANDPLEPANRMVHGVNQAVDHVFLRPVAYAYRDGMPEPIQERVSNGLSNLASPVVLANDLMQGEWDRAWTTFMRFLINSTWGLAGIHDIAAPMGFKRHEEDFGQTLAVAGVDEGPYIVLPLLGPSNARDAVGRAVDWLMDPVRILAAGKNWDEFQMARTGLTIVDARAKLIDPINEIERSSLDTYVAMRSLYRQRREAEISNQPGGYSGVDGASFDFEDKPKTQ